MNTTFGTIQPITLTDERKDELTMTMAASHDVVHDAAVRLYGEPDFRRLRHEFRSGKKIRLRADERATLSQLAEIEQEVLAGFIRVPFNLCKAFYFAERRSAVTLGDWVQEAAQTIFDCIYGFDGSNEFSTYVYWSVKNRLIDFVRSQSEVARSVVAVRVKIVAIMEKESCDFETAVAVLRSKGEIDSKLLDRAAASDVMVRNEDSLSLLEGDHRNDYTAHAALAQFDRDAEDQQRDTKLMWQALEQTELNEFERDLVETFLREGYGSQAKVGRRHKSEFTGKKYSRARAGQIFHRACAKLQITFRQLREAA